MFFTDKLFVLGGDNSVKSAIVHEFNVNLKTSRQVTKRYVASRKAAVANSKTEILVCGGRIKVFDDDAIRAGEFYSLIRNR